MRVSAQRTPSARLGTMPAVIRASRTSTSLGSSRAITGVRLRPGAARSAGLTDIEMTGCLRCPGCAGSVSCTRLTAGIVRAIVLRSSSIAPLCAFSNAWSVSSGSSPAGVRVTRTIAWPGSIAGSSPYCSTSTFCTVPLPHRRFSSASASRSRRSLSSWSMISSLISRVIKVTLSTAAIKGFSGRVRQRSSHPGAWLCWTAVASRISMPPQPVLPARRDPAAGPPRPDLAIGRRQLAGAQDVRHRAGRLHQARHHNDEGIKRTARRLGPPLSHHLDGRLLGYEEARRLFYLPAYSWMLDHRAAGLVARLRELASDRTVAAGIRLDSLVILLGGMTPQAERVVIDEVDKRRTRRNQSENAA